MRSLLLIFFVFLSSFFLYAQKEKSSVYHYLQKYAKTAVQEMEQFGIPASIKLSQAILESSSGNSPLAFTANNHFGIKCGKDWKGQVYYHDDDLQQECFRKYASPLESFRDHSKFLQKSRYQRLFNFPMTDYKSWAIELKSAGYATAPDYANRLITRIEKYQLWRFDKERSQGFENRIKGHLADIQLTDTSTAAERETSKEVSFNIPSSSSVVGQFSRAARLLYHENRGIKYIIVEKNETIPQIANLYNISASRLARYNDVSEQSLILAGQYFFLERKNRSGASNFYRVSQGDTMYSISQKVGIRLKKLYYRNKMQPPQEPQVGDLLWLRGRKK